MPYLNNPNMDADALIARFEREVVNAPAQRRSISALESFKKGLVKKLSKAVKRQSVEGIARTLAADDETKREALLRILSATDDENLEEVLMSLQDIENPSDATIALISKFETSVVSARIDSPLEKLRRLLSLDLFEQQSDSQIRLTLSEDARFDSYPRLHQVLLEILLKDENPEAILSRLQAIETVDWHDPLREERHKAFDEQFPTDERNRDALFQLYGKLVESCRKVAVLYEDNNTPEDDMAYLYAHKIMALFVDSEEPIDDVDARFNDLSQRLNKLLTKTELKLDKPFHDALIVQLSDSFNADSVDMPAWRGLIEHEGLKIFPALNMAERIEEKIKELTGEERAPNDAKEALDIMMRCTYERAEEDTKFAELCHRYHATEYTFNAGLDYMQAPPGWPKKSEDNLPDVLIEGHEAADGFWMMKLPADDKRALILGEITDCCQSISGHSAQCVRDGTALDDNGFYVILKGKTPEKAKIIGQAYGWRSEGGSLCLDSIECLRDNIADTSTKKLLEQFSDAVMEQNPEIRRVTIGCGGKTPEGMFPETAVSEKMKQGEMYGDARQQYCVTTSAIRAYGPLPEDMALNAERREMVECIRAYLPEDEAQDIEQMGLIAGRASHLFSLMGHFESRNASQLFLEISQYQPVLDDLKLLDINELDELPDEARQARLNDISATRITWSGLISDDLSRACNYLTSDERARAIRVIYENKAANQQLHDAVRDHFGSTPGLASALVKASMPPKQPLYSSLVRVLTKDQQVELAQAAANTFKEDAGGFEVFAHIMRSCSGGALDEVLSVAIEHFIELNRGLNSLRLIFTPLSPAQEMRLINHIDSLIEEKKVHARVLLGVFDSCSGGSREQVIQCLIKYGYFGSIERLVFMASSALYVESERKIIWEALAADIPEMLTSLDDVKKLVKAASNLAINIPEGGLPAIQARAGELILTTKDLRDMEVQGPLPLLFPLLSRERFAELIENADDFKLIWSIMPSMKDKAWLLTQMGREGERYIELILPDVMSDTYNFDDFVKRLPERQVIRTLKAALPRLSAMIKGHVNFTSLLRVYPTYMHHAVYQSCRTELIDEISCLTDFVVAAENLPGEDQLDLFEAVKHRLPGRINSIYYFPSPRNFPDNIRDELFDIYIDELYKCNTSLDKLNSLLYPLTDAKRAVVFHDLAEELPAWINTSHDFSEAMEKFASPERTLLYTACSDKIPGFVESIEGFEIVMRDLTESERSALFSEHGTDLIASIETSNDFRLMIRHLSEEDRNTLFNGYENVAGLVKTPKDFEYVMRHLTQTQRNEIFEACHAQLSENVSKGIEFNRLLIHLTEDQRHIIFEACKERLPSMIEKGYDLNYIFEHLSEEQRNEIKESCVNHLPPDFQSSFEFEAMMEYLTVEQRQVSFARYQEKLPEKISYSHDFTAIMKYLTDEQRAYVFDAIIDNLPESFIYKFKCFTSICEYLTEAQQVVLVNKLIDRLPFLIESAEDYQQIASLLSEENRAALHGLIKDFIPDTAAEQGKIKGALGTLRDGEEDNIEEGHEEKKSERPGQS